MANNQKGLDEFQILQSLLAIELWRAGLSQADIGKRLGIATGSVNKILKGVNKYLYVTISKED